MLARKGVSRKMSKVSYDYQKSHYAIKKYRGLSSNYRGERWAYVYLFRGAANYRVIYLLPTFDLHHEICKCVYLRILISEAPTNKTYEVKMHVEARKTIYLSLFQFGK